MVGLGGAPSQAPEGGGALGAESLRLAGERRRREGELLRRYGPPLGREATARWRERRAEWVGRLTSLGAVLGCAENRLHYGRLSPGCELCQRGSWDCVYVTHACTRSCFFCAQPREASTPCPHVGGTPLPSPEALVEHERRRRNGGCALSGGDPLCRLEESLAMVRALRRSLGRHFRIWLYTNGDRLGADALAALRDAGLDEVRVNIAASGYDTAPLCEARDALPSVAVEIPMVPSDEGRLSGLLPELADIGVDHLNLHELVFTPDNFSRLRERGHVCMTGASPMDALAENRPAEGSEEAAFRVMERAARSGSDLGVSICTYCYKVNVQIPALRRRESRLVARPHERVAPDGLCESAVVAGQGAVLGRAASFLAGRGVPRSAMSLEGGRLLVHPDNLAAIAEVAGVPGTETGLLRTLPTSGGGREEVELIAGWRPAPPQKTL